MKLTPILFLTITCCGGSAFELAPSDGEPLAAQVDSGAPDCHVVFVYHSDWPIQCDDAGNCWLTNVDAASE